MKRNASSFSLKKMAKLMKVSRSGYYDYVKRGLSKREWDNINLTQEIRSVYSKNRGLYGSPRIHAALIAQEKE